MFIAKELRKKSIAEYLLYMWQMEDMIRAMGCSLPLIRKAYISKFPGYTNEQKEAELDWFGNLIRMMNEEGKREQGHLNVNTIIIDYCRVISFLSIMLNITRSFLLLLSYVIREIRK